MRARLAAIRVADMTARPRPDPDDWARLADAFDAIRRASEATEQRIARMRR